VCTAIPETTHNPSPLPIDLFAVKNAWNTSSSVPGGSPPPSSAISNLHACVPATVRKWTGVDGVVCSAAFWRRLMSA
jgi:hypothetical protein